MNKNDEAVRLAQVAMRADRDGQRHLRGRGGRHDNGTKARQNKAACRKGNWS